MLDRGKLSSISNLLFLTLELHITSRAQDAEKLSATALGFAGVAWLSIQAKLDGNFLLGDATSTLMLL
jgi:hypothetical protein